MNHPHEQQAAAMARAGELPDGEQLRSGNRCDKCKCEDWCAANGCWTLAECINSGQVSAAQVVAHHDEFTCPYCYDAGRREKSPIMPEPNLLAPGSYPHGVLAYTWDQMQDYAHASVAAERAEVARLTAENESLRETLIFVERWANHHGQKAHMTPQEALSCIQHYPPILSITRSYADGKVPETHDPYAEVARLREALQNLWNASEGTSDAEISARLKARNLLTTPGEKHE